MISASHIQPVCKFKDVMRRGINCSRVVAKMVNRGEPLLCFMYTRYFRERKESIFLRLYVHCFDPKNFKIIRIKSNDYINV